jgi:hypothetical protein
MTSEHSHPNSLPSTADKLTLSAAGSRARTLALPTKTVKELGGAEAGCGQSTHGLFASYDPSTRSWKTSQLCLFQSEVSSQPESQPFLETWPRCGMMRSGTAYRLPTLVPGIGGTESGFLPTPTAASDSKGSPRNRYFNSRTYRGILREYLRNGPDDPIYPHPCFVEAVMGYEVDYTRLETP